MGVTQPGALRVLSRAPRVEDVPSGIDKQPVSAVVWIARDEIQANDYNPNHVASPELKLLKVSILSDGWTQPIVVRDVLEKKKHTHYEVVDGYHRWVVAGDPEVNAMTEGKVPTVVLRPVDLEHRMMSTIRHNRARGSHQVMRMADIVIALADAGKTDLEICGMLGMEDEEVTRLRQRGNMLQRGAAEEFGQGWVPK